MTKQLNTERFSTRVELEETITDRESHFLPITHYCVSGEVGSRSSIMQYKGAWFYAHENENKIGSFVQGAQARTIDIPVDEWIPAEPSEEAAQEATQEPLSGPTPAGGTDARCPVCRLSRDGQEALKLVLAELGESLFADLTEAAA